MAQLDNKQFASSSKENELAAYRKSNLQLLQSGHFSDFTVSCKNVEFRVHRAVICGDSKYFKALCSAGFHESESCKVDLPDEDPDILARVLLYLYTKEVDIEPDAQIVRHLTKSHVEKKPYEILIAIYITADRLLVTNMLERIYTGWCGIFTPFPELGVKDEGLKLVNDDCFLSMLTQLYELTPTNNKLRVHATEKLLEFLMHQFTTKLRERKYPREGEESVKGRILLIERLIKLHEPSAFHLAQKLLSVTRQLSATKDLFSRNGLCKRGGSAGQSVTINRRRGGRGNYAVECTCHGIVEFKDWLEDQ